jgi:hypothetical protein
MKELFDSMARDGILRPMKKCPVLADTARHYSELDQTAEYEAWAEDRLGELKEQYFKQTPFSVALEDTEDYAELDGAWERINEVRNMARPREYDFYAGKVMTKIMEKAAHAWAEKELKRETMPK